MVVDGDEKSVEENIEGVSWLDVLDQRLEPWSDLKSPWFK
jgi:hypothetical protein